VLPLLAAAGGLWWWALRREDHAPSWRVVCLGALALRLVVLGWDPGLSDDLHRYVWEGHLVGQAVSPYAFAPEDEALSRFRHELPRTFQALNNREISAAYPPLTQVACAFATSVARACSHGVETYEERAGWALRLLFVGCDLLILWPLGRLLKAGGRPRSLAVAWAWCPLVCIEFAGSGHFDALGIVLLVGALACLVETPRRARGLVLLGAAVLVKYLPLFVLPFALRGPGWLRRGMGVCVGLVLAFLPFAFFEGGLGGLGSGLSQYALRWEAQSLIYRHVEGFAGLFLERDGTWLDARVVGRVTILAAWGAGAFWMWRRRCSVVEACAGGIGLFLVLSPTLHPWYLTWIVPFLALSSRRASSAWCWLVAVAPILYWPVAAWQSQGIWREPLWMWPLVALPFLALLLWELAAASAATAAPLERGRRRHRASKASIRCSRVAARGSASCNHPCLRPPSHEAAPAQRAP
jgi:hypothetical protein